MMTSPTGTEPHTTPRAVTAWQWWAGIAALAAAIMLHALTSAFLPRYEWRGEPLRMIRIDRWTGRAELRTMTINGWSIVPIEAGWHLP